MQFSPATVKFQTARESLRSLLTSVSTQATLAVLTGPHLTAKQRESLERVAQAAQEAQQRLETGK